MRVLGRWFGADSFRNTPLSLRSALLSIIALAAIPPLIFSGISLQRYATSERLRAQLQLEESAKGLRALSMPNLVRWKPCYWLFPVPHASPIMIWRDLSASCDPSRQKPAACLISPMRTAARSSIFRNQTSASGILPDNWPTARDMVVTDVLQNPEGKLTARDVVPLFRDGGVRWTLQGAVRSDEFRRILAKPRIPQDWIVSLVDRMGSLSLTARQG